MNGETKPSRSGAARHSTTTRTLPFPALAASGLDGATVNAPEETYKMKLEQQDWGNTPDGTRVKLFTLTNGKGMLARIATYGATLTELRMPGHIDGRGFLPLAPPGPLGAL